MRVNLLRVIKERGTCAFATFKKHLHSLLNKTAPFASAVKPLWKKVQPYGFTICSSLAIVSVSALLLACTSSIGYEISVDGQIVGVVKNKQDFTQSLEDINYELALVNQEAFELPAPAKLSLKVIPKGKFTNEADLREQIKATNSRMLPAYAIYANDRLLFSVPNKETATNLLTAYKSEFVQDKENVQVDFCESITVARRFVPKTSLRTAARGDEMLRTGQVLVHTLATGETLEDFAQANGVSMDALYRDNGSDVLASPYGKTIRVYTEKPMVSVKTTEFITMEEEIPFETISKENPDDYQGNIKVEQKGVPGSRVIEAYVTSINGKQTARKIVSENILSTAVDEIVYEGTKEPPSSIGTGSMVTPTKGNLSSRFGARWGRNHSGIDLTASVGTPIYAADNGTVVYSEFNNGGYGYLIQIDHGNGAVTYYAHCSELLVPAGSVVAKGDLIAKVGNTGRSTGPHLHFEVRLNGTPIDPLTYLKNIG